jgi:4-amino-4-deoxy-L-arabinose transferase-like glycosyltransferase
MILSVVVIATYLALAIVQAGEPLVIDEMEFPRLAEAVADTGRPVYYRGEETPAQIGVYHPPLYGYTLGGWVALFGFSEEAVRLFGILLMIATALVFTRIVRLLGVAGRWGSPIFLGLFLLHPYVVQSALLPDIDGTMLLFATGLVFYEVIRAATSDEGIGRGGLRVGLALALALASKLTSILLLPAVFIGILLGRGPRRASAITGLAALVGSAAFLTLWWVVASVADLPFAYPFEFTVQSGLKGGVGDAGITELLARLIPANYTIFWLGILLPVLAVIGTANLIGQWKDRPERRPALVLALWSVGAIGFYSLITGPPFGFPKYFITSLPTMAVLGVVAAEWVMERVSSRKFGATLVLLALGSISVLAGWRFAAVADEGRYAWPGFLWLVVLVLLSGAAAAAIMKGRGRQLAIFLVAGVAISTVAYNASMSAVQAADTRSVRYFPGEVGFDETVAFLKSRVGPDDPILVPKDIGSATYNVYHEQETLFLDEDALAAVLADDDIPYAVVRRDWDYSYLVFPEVESIIEREMDLSDTIGDFLIYERSATPSS